MPNWIKWLGKEVWKAMATPPKGRPVSWKKYKRELTILKFDLPEELRWVSPSILCPDCGYDANFVMVEFSENSKRLYFYCGTCDIGG